MSGFRIHTCHCLLTSLAALLGFIFHYTLGIAETCSVNLCLVDVPNLTCATGSMILIQHVTCLSEGQSCDTMAYRQLTNVCSGRPFCTHRQFGTIRSRVCSDNTPEDHSRGRLSVLFVNYACIRTHSIENRCNRDGITVSNSTPYISSPGYPAMVRRTSACVWYINVPAGQQVDFRIQEYRHADRQGRQFFRIRQYRDDGIGLKLEKDAKRDLRVTFEGNVELILFTYGSKKGHRAWLEYRTLTSAPDGDHLEPFPMPNKTQCRVAFINKTSYLTDSNLPKEQILKDPEKTSISPANGNTTTKITYTSTVPIYISEPSTVSSVIEARNKTGVISALHRMVPKRDGVVVAVVVAIVITAGFITLVAIKRHKIRLRKYQLEPRHPRPLTKLSVDTDMMSPSPAPSYCTQMTDCSEIPGDLATSDLSAHATAIDFTKYIITQGKRPPETTEPWMQQHFRPIYTVHEDGALHG